MTYLLLGLAALVLFLVLARVFVQTDPKRLAAMLRKAGGWALLAIAGVLALRGGFVAAIPLAVFGMALLGRGMPSGFSFPGSGPRSPGQQSRVRTAHLEMSLDHDSGRMDGRVLQGRFAGQTLSDMTLADLIALWSEWRSSDPQSGQLLEAYLDRRDGGWRAAAGATGGGGSGAGRESGRSGGAMSMEEAYEVLGLRPGASAADIRRAHRSLMKRMHPDQGGSTYLAAKLNQAKDVLLKRRG